MRSKYLAGVPHLPQRLLDLFDGRCKRSIGPADERAADQHLERIKRLIRERRATWEAEGHQVWVEPVADF